METEGSRCPEAGEFEGCRRRGLGDTGDDWDASDNVNELAGGESRLAVNDASFGDRPCVKGSDRPGENESEGCGGVVDGGKLVVSEGEFRSWGGLEASGGRVVGRRGRCDKCDKSEKAPPGSSNGDRGGGEVELGESGEGFAATGTKAGDNERFDDSRSLTLEENEMELEDERDEVEEVEEELGCVAEEPEGNGNKFRDNGEEVKSNPTEV